MVEAAAIAFITLYAIPRMLFFILSVINGAAGLFSNPEAEAQKARETRALQDEYLRWDRETRIKYHVHCRRNGYPEVLEAMDLELDVQRRMRNGN